MPMSFTPEQLMVLSGPSFSVFEYYKLFPEDERSPEALMRAHRRYRGVRFPDPDPALAPQIQRGKKEIDFHWRDVLKPLQEMQEIQHKASGSQDHAIIRVDADEPFPVMFLSDVHIGSWGTDYRRFVEITEKVLDNGIHLAVLGDILQMAIKLRGVLEVSDNALTPLMQHRVLESWSNDVEPLLLWSTWDNHAVQRQEDASGFSAYAEVFRKKCIYHSGIGHIDLYVGEQCYKIASSHRFSGNTPLNPLSGQVRYMRHEGIDREIAVAGDSHRPAYQRYADGPISRLAINCGTLQTNSGYAKRHFSLYTHDWMPVVVFDPSEHRMNVYESIEHYLNR